MNRRGAPQQCHGTSRHAAAHAAALLRWWLPHCVPSRPFSPLNPPRMDWTDVHYRQLARLLSAKAWLYTEMVVDATLLHNPDTDR